MKQDQLLDAIGGVDETMLLQSEQPVSRNRIGIGKALLIAAVIAALAGTVGAATGLFSQPIHDSDIFTDETAAPFAMDSDGNILPTPINGLRITMDVDVAENAPDHLEEYYLLDAPQGWQSSGMGTHEGRYYLRSWEQIFWTDSYSERIELRQSTTYYYLTGEHRQVDTLLKLTEKDGVTAVTTQMAGLEVLKVTIPELPWRDNLQGKLYCLQGETRLYWSDGRYILRLIYPAGVTDAQAEEMLKTLHTEKVILNLPEDYGKVNAQKLQNLNPLFSIEPGSTTTANIQMGQGKVALHNGKLYIGAHGQIIVYDLETGQQRSCVLGEKLADPKCLFATDNYVGYVTDYDRLELLPLDGSKAEIVAYEGIDSTCLYADGMTLYAQGDGLRRIDLSTGEITRLAENVMTYDIQGDTLYVLQQGENHFLKSEKGSGEFEKVELDFYPIRVLAEGEDLYFCASAENGKYPVIRYRDGEITKLPMNAWMYQILDGKLIYLDQKDKKYPVKSYDLETGETVTLMENVFEFSILQDRYLVCQLYNDGYEIHDLHTGETHRIPENP